MKNKPGIEDLIGLGHTKLGFFKEVQIKIGELKQSNLELETKRRQVQAILDGITDIVAVISPDYRIRSVNQSFYDFYPRAVPLGACCHTIFRGSGVPCADCVLREALAANQARHQEVIIHLGGRNRRFSITASPLKNQDGRQPDILIVKRDVTLEKEFQAKYHHAEKMATIGLLAAGVAHEINNPLTSISGFAEGLQRRLALLAAVIEDDGLKRDMDEYLAIILKECRRCSGIVESLLTFSPRRDKAFTVLDMNQLVHNVLRILHYKFKHYPQNLVKLDLAQGLPLVKGIFAELEQVILNLILNALDAVEGAGDQGRIDIRTRMEDQHYLVLEVADNGCGITPEVRSKLFEPFFTTKPPGRGIGIGLSTCYHIIEAHRGEISVRSEPGRGACFTVRLPLDHAVDSVKED